MNLNELFEEAAARKASDVHLVSGEVARIRIDGLLTRLDEPALSSDEFAALLDPVVPPEAWARVRSGVPYERTVTHAKFNITLTLLRAANDRYAATFRIVLGDIPDLAQAGEGAMDLIESIMDAPCGLALIAGPPGSGKVTTASSIVEAINAAKPARIFVIQCTPAFVFSSKEGLVTQICVGQDIDTCERALEYCHRADPDVIAVNDITNGEVLRQLVILAETGHLVIANLHAESVPDVFRRLANAAGSEAEALYTALAKTLLAVTVQRLLRRTDRLGRVPAFEWLKCGPAVREAVAAGDLAKIAALQATDPDCRSLQAALDALVAEGKIGREAAEARLGGTS